ncbi:MAG: hypothetical protein F4013_10200, partial [Gammaproteobacteria bacterium]|nr:hypothetical protein [Gammaproteobacteria bacterium]
PTLPRFRLLSRSHESASVSTDQVIDSDSTYQECEFYQDFLRPTRVHAAMIFGVNIEGRQFGLVGLHRTKPMGHFSEVDHKLTQLLIPYLSMALRFRYSQRQQQRRDDVVSNLLRFRGIRGYLMLDQNFVLRDVVGEFESPDLVVKGADLERRRGCSVFQLLSPSVKESLLRSRNAAAAAGEITNRRDPYRVEVVQHSDGTRHYVLVALDRSHSLISERRVRERSLSPRQAQVVKLVALGMTNAEIAASLGIQTKTVENYLTAIYQKTGTSNRTELVAVLSN